MRVLRLHGPMDLRMHDEPIPTPAADEVLVRIKSVGICASDLHYYREGRIGSTVVTSPIVLGHEASGVVESVGTEVTDLKPGDHVALEPAKPCLKCEWCLKGHYNVCPGIPFFGTPPVDGCLRDYITWPARLCLKVGESLTFDEAAMLEPLAIGLYACDLAAPNPDDVVAILGAGGIGLSVLQAVRTAGVKRVIVSEPVEARRLAALKLGATQVTTPTTAEQDIAKFTNGRGADIVIECTGEDDAVRQTARIARVLGKILIVGIPSSDTYPFDASDARRKQLTAIFVRRSNKTTERAAELVAQGKMDAAVLATHRFPLEKTAEAMELAFSKSDGVIRAIVVVSE
ncbi:MAG: NAD(P)-dependent alcohol dehydrogenase [Armatimonadota bacterium]|nr:NAD(P)-dependent alcohol dehydrogenase [Armatimonadota bacterium]